MKVVGHVLVRTGPEIVVPDGLREAVVKIIFLHINMAPDKGFAAISGKVVFDIVVIAAIAGSQGALVSLLSFPVAFLVDQFIQISPG